MLAYIPYMDPMGTIPESQSCSTRFQPIPTPSFPWLSQSPKISQKIVDHTRSLKLISIAIVQYTYHLHIFYTYSIHILYIFYTYSIHILYILFYTYSIHIYTYLSIFYTYSIHIHIIATLSQDFLTTNQNRKFGGFYRIFSSVANFANVSCDMLW